MNLAPLSRSLMLACALWPVAARAQQQQQHVAQPQHTPAQHMATDPLERHLFPPELIMRHQRELGLSADQRTVITRAIQEFQNKTVELQWRMQDQTQRLAELLAKPAVDQAVALQQLDEVLAVEREVKRAHIGLLVQVKNALTPEQQAKLSALHDQP
ncbi:MAG TPA: periplasmic heavy metal sensor [Gemmatimonadales bacterium]|nr:periplasmic heavy metal sensor [Gemmatimonadales bacterium]